jgi:hypothetical protein
MGGDKTRRQDQGQTDLSTRRKNGALGQDQGQTDLSTRRKNGALGQIRLSLGGSLGVWVGRGADCGASSA